MIGRVYQIKHQTQSISYVGSTTNSIHRRWLDHGCNFRAWCKGAGSSTCSLFPYLRKYGLDQFEITLLKEYDVVDKNHLHAYEQLWINKLSPVNKHNPFSPLSPSLNRVIYKQDYKARYQASKEKNNAKWICECGNPISKNSMYYHFRGNKHQRYVNTVESRQKKRVNTNNYQTIDLLMDRLLGCKSAG